ncbi:MAG: hypothetical protein A3C80_04625 [Candidatus Ryanbacteria bacterium RIFCSPHIGHO2_02_FULL_45_43]|nr:MAG: hypothetical protein A3C80_04625 [Candidatus Ryanbacteria bacterium RIFCSPHIGHO2_02_FULL_45_43]
MGGNTCQNLGYDEGGVSCYANCTLNTTQCRNIPSPVCGNGVIESGETCDDANMRSGDGCSVSCAVESGWTCTSANPSNCSPKQPPQAVISAPSSVTDSDGNGSEIITLDGAGSFDPDGSVKSYRWEKTGISIGTAVQQTVTQVADGSAHSYKLTVTDNDGLTGAATVNVVVHPKSTPEPPIVDGDWPYDFDPAISMRSSITQGEVTFYFDKAYQSGRFLTGGHWVVGPVTITRITPDYSNQNNGVMLNPQTSGSHAYDGDVSGFTTNLLLPIPSKISHGSSVVKAVSSRLDHANCTTKYNGEDFPGILSPLGHCERIASTAIHSAEVLTVLSGVPPRLSLRPPFVGSEKPLYDIQNVDFNLIPTLSTDGITLPSSSKRAGLLNVIKAPWLMHKTEWSGRDLHPSNTLDYHEEITSYYSDVAVFILLDLPKVEKRSLIAYMIQRGMDDYFTHKIGHGDSSFYYYPVLFAGHLLNDPDILNFFKDSHNALSDQGSRMKTRSRDKFYFSSDGTSKIVSTIVPKGRGWTGAKVLFRKQTSNGEHEHLHPTEWSKVDASGGGSKMESYRRCCDKGFEGMAFALQILGISSYTDHPPLFAYARRWKEENLSLIPNFKTLTGADPSSYGGSSALVDSVWKKHFNASSQGWPAWK